MTFVIWILACYGITQIIVESGLFENPRGWLLKKTPLIGRLANCILCASVWVGFLLSILVWSPSTFYFGDEMGNHLIGLNYSKTVKIILSVFVDGMIASSLVWLIHIAELFVNYGISISNDKINDK